jgi:hypothetical protein
VVAVPELEPGDPLFVEPAPEHVVQALPCKPPSNRHFQVLDLHWRSPESGGLWYTSRQLEKTEKTICSPSGVTRN